MFNNPPTKDPTLPNLTGDEFLCSFCGKNMVSIEDVKTHYMDFEYGKQFIHIICDDCLKLRIPNLGIKIERFTLVKSGFPNIYLRKYYGLSDTEYVWESQTRSAFGWNDAKWERIDMRLFPEESILENIRLYEEKTND